MLDDYKESVEARQKGVRYVIASGASFFIRRAGMAAWRQAVKDATDEVHGASYSFNHIDPANEDLILCKACSEYLIAGWDDLKDASGEPIPYSLSTCRNMFEAEGLPYYALATELIAAATEHDRFLEKVVKEDIDYIKKS